MILFSGSNVGKIKTAVFSEATKKRRPRTSWMAKPSPAAATEGAKIPAAPAAPGFSERRPESILPEALDAERAEHRPAPPAAVPPAVIHARAANVEVDRDEKLGPGACIVETELGRVDESVELRLTSVLTHLFGQSDDSDFPRKGG